MGHFGHYLTSKERPMNATDTIVKKGIVASKPKLKATDGGSYLCTFSLRLEQVHLHEGVGEVIANEPGRFIVTICRACWDGPQFHNIVLWDDLATMASQDLSTGDRVQVEGRLERRTWPTRTGEVKNQEQVRAHAFWPLTRDGHIYCETHKQRHCGVTQRHRERYTHKLRETYTLRERHKHCETHTLRQTHTERDIHSERETHILRDTHTLRTRNTHTERDTHTEAETQ